MRSTLHRFGKWLTYRTAPALSEGEARWLPQVRFQHILKTADDIAAKNPLALVDLVRALLRPLQSEYLLGVAEVGRDPHPAIRPVSFFGAAVGSYLCRNGRELGRLLDPTTFTVRLARDPVLPWAWNYGSYVGALAMIGSAKELPGSWRGRENWQWRQDPVNHRVELWLPWGISFLHGGNHSITAGILAGEGELSPDSVFDMSLLLERIESDGTHYICRNTGNKLGTVSDVRIAAVFEIGRLMLRNSGSAFSTSREDSEC